MRWYYGNILQNSITESYDGMILRKYITELYYGDALQQIYPGGYIPADIFWQIYYSTHIYIYYGRYIEADVLW